MALDRRGDSVEGGGGGFRYIISDVSSRLQEVGQGALSLESMVQVDDALFTNHPEAGGDFGKQLLSARDTGIPLLEVVAVERGGRIADGIFDIMGVEPGGSLVMKAAMCDGAETNHWDDGKQLTIKGVGLVLPGIHAIPLSGGYGHRVESLLESSHYSGYDRIGERNSFGRIIKPSSGSSYTYETDYRGAREMHAVLDLIEAQFATGPLGISEGSNGLAIAESASRPEARFAKGASPQEFAELVHELLEKRERATIRIACEDFTLPSAIVFGAGVEIQGNYYRFVELFGGAMEHYYGISPTKWRTEKTPGYDDMEPYSESIVLVFGDEDSVADLRFEDEAFLEPAAQDSPDGEAEDAPNVVILPEDPTGSEAIEDAVFYRDGAGESVLVDPATLNLDELPLVLAMAGWVVCVNFTDNQGKTVGLSLNDFGGAGGRTGMELALELNMIDLETGELLPGFTVSDDSGLGISYSGPTNMRFAEFVKSLYTLSPFAL